MSHCIQTLGIPVVHASCHDSLCMSAILQHILYFLWKGRQYFLNQILSLEFYAFLLVCHVGWNKARVGNFCGNFHPCQLHEKYSVYTAAIFHTKEFRLAETSSEVNISLSPTPIHHSSVYHLPEIKEAAGH